MGSLTLVMTANREVVNAST